MVTEGRNLGISVKPLNSFLAESLNVELINIILQGITIFSNPSIQKIREEELRGLPDDFKIRDLGEFKVRELDLVRIKISNLDDNKDMGYI